MFRGEATKWGLDHEKEAGEAYLMLAQYNHSNVNISDWIGHTHPLPVSPDGYIACS